LKKIVETVNFCEAFLRKIARYFSEYNKSILLIKNFKNKGMAKKLEK